MSRIKPGQFGEPWRVGQVAFSDAKVKASAGRVILDLGDRNSDAMLRDAQRIVDCVNACDGWEVADVEKALRFFEENYDEG